MKNHPIETIVFDLGGVLIDWNPRYLFRSIFKDRESDMEYFLTMVCNQEWNEKQDAGRSFAAAELEVVKKFPQFKSEIEIYFKRWNETLGKQIDGSVKILEQIAAKNEHQLLALSNWSAETFHFARKKFEFLKIFEVILVSGEEKLIKPDPRFFNLLVERHRVVPQNTIFIDDVEKNIRGAEMLGFQTIHFQNPGQLQDRLNQLIY